MRKIALINQKGGVAKTTSTINIGAGLTLLGKKVMLIDLDPQSHLTYSLGIEAHTLELTVYDLLKNGASPGKTMITRGEIKLIPSTLNLAGAEIELASVAGREFLLKEALKDVEGYDYILIDCGPSLGLLTLNALVATKEVYIPMQTEFLALRGLSRLLETIEIIKTRLNSDLEITGIIGTRYDSRKILNREILDNIKEYFGDKVFNTLIRENISLAEAPSHGQTIFEYARGSHGAKDYLNLCKEIIER